MLIVLLASPAVFFTASLIFSGIAIWQLLSTLKSAVPTALTLISVTLCTAGMAMLGFSENWKLGILAMLAALVCLMNVTLLLGAFYEDRRRKKARVKA